MTEPVRLTSEDIDALGQRVRSGGDSADAVTQLVAAVEERLLEDPADTPYAFTLAAEITQQNGDLEGAIDLAERAVAAHRQYREGDTDFASAFLGELLLQSGRTDEGIGVLAGLRPSMTADPMAGPMVAEALEASGQAELAVQWLGEEIDAAVEAGVSMGEDDPGRDVSTEVVYELVRARHRIRGELGLEHDKYDELAHEMEETLADLADPGPLPFWPQAEFEQLLTRWPDVAEEWGSTWEEHRQSLEHELQAWDETGLSGLEILVGSVDELVTYAAAEGKDAADVEVQYAYFEDLPDGREVPWPPARNGPCWCGSGAKYKKCCLPRGRS